MYQPNYGYQYPYYGTQPPMPDNLAQLRMNTNQMQNAVVQPSMPSQPMQAQSAQQSSQIIWVSGEAGAKSYLVAPGNTVMLLDAENSVFYLKSADASGMPLPLRVFEYKERTETAQQTAGGSVAAFDDLDNKFVTRDEFERRMASIAPQKKSKNKLTEDAEDGDTTI
jgi:nitrous oxide reductase accessory protein NosL